MPRYRPRRPVPRAYDRPKLIRYYFTPSKFYALVFSDVSTLLTLDPLANPPPDMAG